MRQAVTSITAESCPSAIAGCDGHWSKRLGQGLAALRILVPFTNGAASAGKRPMSRSSSLRAACAKSFGRSCRNSATLPQCLRPEPFPRSLRSPNDDGNSVRLFKEWRAGDLILPCVHPGTERSVIPYLPNRMDRAPQKQTHLPARAPRLAGTAPNNLLESRSSRRGTPAHFTA